MSDETNERRVKLAKYETRALKAAECWFEGRRPIAYTLAQHLLNPKVNCTSDAEGALAEAVAILISERRRDAKVSEANTHKLAQRRGGKK